MSTKAAATCVRPALQSVTNVSEPLNHACTSLSCDPVMAVWEFRVWNEAKSSSSLHMLEIDVRLALLAVVASVAKFWPSLTAVAACVCAIPMATDTKSRAVAAEDARGSAFRAERQEAGKFVAPQACVTMLLLVPGAGLATCFKFRRECCMEAACTEDGAWRRRKEKRSTRRRRRR